MSANIVRFDPNKSEIRFRPPKRPCRHQRSIVVRAQTRTVECNECGAVLDPFEFLADWAKGVGFWEMTLKRAKDEAKRLGKQIATLKRLERNAKGRTGRLMKLPEEWAINFEVERRLREMQEGNT